MAFTTVKLATRITGFIQAMPISPLIIPVIWSPLGTVVGRIMTPRRVPIIGRGLLIGFITVTYRLLTRRALCRTRQTPMGPPQAPRLVAWDTMLPVIPSGLGWISCGTDLRLPWVLWGKWEIALLPLLPAERPWAMKWKMAGISPLEPRRAPM
jgi:hypothetical protein